MNSEIVPVVLAAGDSTRMGFPKALLPIGNRTFLTRILDILEDLQLQDPIVVLGRAAGRIEPVLAGRKERILINTTPDRGQLSSIQLAVSSLPPDCTGCLIWPVDHPAVSETLVRNLVRLFCDSHASLVMPNQGQKRGHPAIFHRRLFGELLAEAPERGLKEMVLRNQSQMVLLDMEEGAAIADVDTPDEYFRLTGEKLDTVLARPDPSGTHQE